MKIVEHAIWIERYAGVHYSEDCWERCDDKIYNTLPAARLRLIALQEESPHGGFRIQITTTKTIRTSRTLKR